VLREHAGTGEADGRGSGPSPHRRRLLLHLHTGQIRRLRGGHPNRHCAVHAPSWETTSLCVGWAVRDVVAHLAATATLSRVGFAREFVRARFSLDRIVDRQVALARKLDASASLEFSSNINCVQPLDNLRTWDVNTGHGSSFLCPPCEAFRIADPYRLSVEADPAAVGEFSERLVHRFP
jgi:hypothetical protein